MKKSAVFLLVITIIIGVVGMAAAAEKGPGRLVWSCGKAGTSTYRIGLGVSNLLNKYPEVPPITLHPHPTIDAALKSVHKNRAQLIAGHNSQAYYYSRGIRSEFQREVQEAMPELRMLMGASTLYWSWVVRPESKIETLADIKGKRINYITPGHGMKKALGNDILKALGIDPAKDVKQVTVDDPNVAKAGVQQGKIDALLTALVGGKLMELKSLAHIQVLDIPPEVFNAFRPELKKIMVLRRLPAKHLAVLDRATWVVGHPSLLMTRKDMDDELAYAVVKTIMAHARELDEVSPVFKEWGAEGYVLYKELSIPFHPGAVKYFKEKGMWTPDLQTQQDALLAELAKVSK